MTVEIFPPWSNRFRLPDSHAGFGGKALNYKPPQFASSQDGDRVYDLPSLEELVAGTSWTTARFREALETALEPLIVEDDYGDYPDVDQNVLEKGNPRLEWQPPEQGLGRVSEVIKGIVVADVTGGGTTTVEVSLPDAGDSITATMLLPDGLTWDQVNPQYKQNDVIMVFHTPDDQWFVAGGFHSTASGMFRARTTAAWDSGLTTTATLYLTGDTPGSPSGSTVTVTFLETWSADRFPVISIDEEIAIFQDVDDDWTSPQLFINTSPISFLTDWYLSGDDLKVKSRVINVINPQSEGTETKITTQTLTFLTDIYKHAPVADPDNKAYDSGDPTIGGIRKDFYTSVRVLGAAAKTEDVQAVPFNAKYAAVDISYDADNNLLQLDLEQWLILSNTTSPVTTNMSGGILLTDEHLADNIQYTDDGNLLNLTTRKITVFEAATGTPSGGITLYDEHLADNIQYAAGTNLLNLSTRKITVFERTTGDPSAGFNLTDKDVATDVVFTDGATATLKCLTRTLPTFEWSAADGTSAGINLVKDDLGDDIVYDGADQKLKLTTRTVTSFLFAAGSISTGAQLTARVVAYDIARDGNFIVANRKKVYTFDDDTEVNSTGVEFVAQASVFVNAEFGIGTIKFTTKNVYVWSTAVGTDDEHLTTTVCP